MQCNALLYNDNSPVPDLKTYAKNLIDISKVHLYKNSQKLPNTKFARFHPVFLVHVCLPEIWGKHLANFVCQKGSLGLFLKEMSFS